MFSCVRLFATLWTVAQQAPLVHGISQARILVCCHFLLQGIFLIQGLNLWLLYLLHSQEDSFTNEPPGKPQGEY